MLNLRSNTQIITDQTQLNRVLSGTRILAGSLLIGSLLMVGCASKPVVSNSRTFYIPEYYTVQSGDSLSKIATRYGLNYAEIARINDINAMDQIFIGQSLKLRSADASAPRLVRTTGLGQQPVIQQQTMTTALPTAQASVPQVASTTPKTNTNTSSTVNYPPKTISTTKAPAVTATPSIATPSVPQNTGQLKWVVPSNGAIISRFNLAQDIKGVRFGGKVGDPVYAATAGEVVYADDGLKEYGKLILLRHTNGYITAYAHNQKLNVKVGEKVATGQKIAEMGSTGTSRVMLEFQIRLDGKPINPATVLPIS